MNNVPLTVWTGSHFGGFVPKTVVSRKKKKRIRNGFEQVNKIRGQIER